MLTRRRLFLQHFSRVEQHHFQMCACGNMIDYEIAFKIDLVSIHLRSFIETSQARLVKSSETYSAKPMACRCLIGTTFGGKVCFRKYLRR